MHRAATYWRSCPSTILLICFLGAGFLFEQTLGDGLGPAVQRWGVVPADITPILAHSRSANASGLVTFVSASFLHAGWFHLAANLAYLAVFGALVEQRGGHMLCAAAFLLSAAAGDLAYVLAAPAAIEPAIGASGGVAGLIAAYLLLYPRQTIQALAPSLTTDIGGATPASLLLIPWFVTQLVQGLAGFSPQLSTVGWWPHLGGFLMGAILGAVLRLRGHRMRFVRVT